MIIVCIRKYLFKLFFQNCTFWIISTTYLLNSSFFSDPISEITSSGKGIRSTRFASLRRTKRSQTNMNSIESQRSTRITLFYHKNINIKEFKRFEYLEDLNIDYLHCKYHDLLRH